MHGNCGQWQELNGVFEKPVVSLVVSQIGGVLANLPNDANHAVVAGSSERYFIGAGSTEYGGDNGFAVSEHGFTLNRLYRYPAAGPTTGVPGASGVEESDVSGTRPSTRAFGDIMPAAPGDSGSSDGGCGKSGVDSHHPGLPMKCYMLDDIAHCDLMMGCTDAAWDACVATRPIISKALELATGGCMSAPWCTQDSKGCTTMGFTADCIKCAQNMGGGGESQRVPSSPVALGGGCGSCGNGGGDSGWSSPLPAHPPGVGELGPEGGMGFGSIGADGAAVLMPPFGMYGPGVPGAEMTFGISWNWPWIDPVGRWKRCYRKCMDGWTQPIPWSSLTRGQQWWFIGSVSAVLAAFLTMLVALAGGEAALIDAGFGGLGPLGTALATAIARILTKCGFDPNEFRAPIGQARDLAGILAWLAYMGVGISVLAGLAIDLTWQATDYLSRSHRFQFCTLWCSGKTAIGL